MSEAARASLQSRIDGLALERKHGEDAFVHTSERLARNETLEPFMAKREFAHRRRGSLVRCRRRYRVRHR